MEAVGRLATASRLGDALRVVDAALALHPNDAQLLLARGWVLFESGRTWEARRDLLDAEALGQKDATLNLKLGWLELRAGRTDDAAQRMRDAVHDSEEDWRAHFGLGSALSAKDDWSAAQESYLRALDLSHGDVDCFLNLVSCAIAERRFDEAETYARRTTSAQPSSHAAWASLGIALLWQDRFAEATAAFDRARDIASQDVESSAPILDAGISMRDGGSVHDAIAFYRGLLPAHPDLNAHGHYAYSLLKAGQLGEGWEQYEFRWMIEPLRFLVPRPPVPVWTGQDVRGKTVLIMGEQGIGDMIQFVRYARPLKARGAKVLVLLRKRMREIVEGIAGVDEVFDLGEELPSFDFRVPVMSLPRAFATTLETIPSMVPYIPLKPDRVHRWQSEIASGGCLNVGIAWAGDPTGLRNAFKSIPLRLLAPLGSVAGVRFYSLQKGEAAGEAAHAPPELRLVDLSPHIRDLADTAAIIDSLDLVITICTSVAHLAGALAKPVWTLVSEPADWRWMQDRNDTPWYPTMRLIRQKRQGDWIGVVHEVSRMLEAVVSNRHALPVRSKSPPSALSDPIDGCASTPPCTGPICRAAATRYGMLQFRPDGSAASRSIEWYGEYRRRQLGFLANRIERGRIVVDVASGSGFDSAVLASAVGDAGHAFLLESRRVHLPLLANNLHANDVSNATSIRRPIIGAVDQSTPEAPGGSASCSLDDLCLPRFQLLKINEGADPVRILRGAANGLWDFRPAIMVFATDEAAVREAGECAADFAYQSLRLDFPLFDVGNFNSRPVDIFGGETAFALFALPEELDLQAAEDEWKRIVDRCNA